MPRGADSPNCPYFFWSGHGTKNAVIRDATRSLGVVYDASGVAGACSHRFRHTATEVLELGGTSEEAADILGDTRRLFASITPSVAPRDRPESLDSWHVYGTRKNRSRKVSISEAVIWWTW